MVGISFAGQTDAGQNAGADQLVRAAVFCEVPDLDAPLLVAADELALIRMDDDLVDGRLVVIVALNVTRPGIPDLERMVLGRGDEPL